ncbi:MAG: hypothetical protein H6996_10380 [Moraxellaceae bacterium]|nr:hypothetical protein [Moraxellaceae bacterium]
MNAQIKSLGSINQDVNKLLIDKIGIVNTLRFYNQFNTGQGDYVEQHQKLAQELTLDDIFDESQVQTNH